MSNENIILKNQKLNKISKLDIDTVWNLLRDFKQIFEVFKEFRREAIFTRGNNSFEIGSEFHFTWKNLLTLYFRTIEIEDKTNYKKIIMRVYKSEPINIIYDYIYSLHRITADNTTLLIWEWIYDGEGISINPFEIVLL
jgi:hypothetical protein